MSSEQVMDPKEAFELITKDLQQQEVINGEIIKHVLEVQKRPLKIYWGSCILNFLKIY